MNKILEENMRKKGVLNYLNENYFIAVYSEKDNYLFSFDTLEETSYFFKMPIKEILRKLRQNTFINDNGVFVKLYLYKKENEYSVRKR